MTSSKQEYGQLDFDRGLGGVGIVMEYVVVTDLVDDAVEDVRINMHSSPVLVEISSAPLFEEGKL